MPTPGAAWEKKDVRSCACAWLFVLGLGGAGCLDDALGIPLDGGLTFRHDLAHPEDLAHVDLAGVDLAGVDLASVDLTPGCTHVDTWPPAAVEVLGSPTEAPFDYVTWARTIDAGQRELSVEVWHRNGSPVPPYSLALPGDTNYLLCEVCVLVDLNYQPAQGHGGPAYLALSGAVSVDQSDIVPSGGGLSVTGTGVRLVEWDFAGDRPAQGGGCFTIDVFTLGGQYKGDGGDPPRWKGQ